MFKVFMDINVSEKDISFNQLHDENQILNGNKTLIKIPKRRNCNTNNDVY